MIRTIALILICLLFAGNGASASFEASMDGRCALQVFTEISSVPVDDGSDAPETSTGEHASQCHDHCKSGGRSSPFKVSAAAEAPPAPLALTLEQSELPRLIRPPR